MKLQLRLGYLTKKFQSQLKLQIKKRAILQWSVIKATFKRLPLGWWSVLQRCKQRRKCSNMLSTCWKNKNVLKTEGSTMWRRKDIFSEESSPKMGPNVCNTVYSQVVTRTGTDATQRDLTWVIGREPVRSLWCGRRRKKQLKPCPIAWTLF